MTGALISGALLAAVAVWVRWLNRRAARPPYPDAWRTWQRAPRAGSGDERD
ncbi:MAG: hypothetical protein ACTHPS_05310 [Streptosporangiaceae bacterium]